EPLVHPRLIVERLHLRRRADEVEVDGAIGLGREVRQVGAAGPLDSRRGAAELRSEHGRERDAAEAASAAGEELPPGFGQDTFVSGVHFVLPPYLFSASSKFNIWFATIVQA